MQVLIPSTFHEVCMSARMNRRDAAKLQLIEVICTGCRARSRTGIKWKKFTSTGEELWEIIGTKGDRGGLHWLRYSPPPCDPETWYQIPVYETKIPPKPYHPAWVQCTTRGPSSLSKSQRTTWGFQTNFWKFQLSPLRANSRRLKTIDFASETTCLYQATQRQMMQSCDGHRFSLFSTTK